MSKRKYFKQIDESDKAAKQLAEEDARNELEIRLEDIRDNFKNEILIFFGDFLNAAGGYHLSFALLNNTSKPVKYVDVNFKVLNSVGGVCVIKYQEDNICRLEEQVRSLQKIKRTILEPIRQQQLITMICPDQI